MNLKAIEVARKSLGVEKINSILGTNISEKEPGEIAPAEPQQGNHATREWGEIIPFDEYEVPLFPIEMFPKWLRDYIEDVAEHTQTPVDMACMMALSVLSVALAKRYSIQPSKGWHEPLNTYLITFMPPSNRKSSVFKAFTFPLLEHENEENMKRQIEIEQSRHEKDVLERIIEDLKKDLVKAKQNQSEEDAAAIQGELYAKIVEMEKAEFVHPLRYFTDDVTPEQLITLMLNNDGRMAVLSAEGGFFDLIKGRYSNHTNIDVYLKGFSQDQITVDRRGRTEKVDDPHLTVGLFAQLDVIKRLPEYFYNRGLMARFLYAIPKSFIGYRKIETAEIREDIQLLYSKQMKRLLHVQHENVILTLSEEAQPLFNKYRIYMETLMREGNELSYGHFQSWAGKLVGQVARIIALVHIAHHANCGSIPTEISKETVHRTLHVSKYLINHMMATFGLLSEGNTDDDAKFVLKHLVKKNCEQVLYREIQQATKKRVKSDKLKDILNGLEERNYIRKVKEGKKEKIVVNPYLRK